MRRSRTTPKTIKPHEEEALLRKVAEVTGLPYEFFTVDFARLGEVATSSPAAAERGVEDRLDRLERLFDAIARDTGYDDYRALVDSTRRVTQRLKGQLPDVEEATPAPADTRDEADASPGEARAPGEATPRTGRSTGG